MPRSVGMKIQNDEQSDTRETGAIVDAEEAAENAGLVHVSDNASGITRENIKGKFRYRDVKGNLIMDEKTLKRIASLTIPSAYTNV